MTQALNLAQQAKNIGEVPVGALIIKDGEIIGKGFNRKETQNQVIQHAEINAIIEASTHLASWRLLDCDLFVTLEPCLMCAGAIYQARLRSVTFGAFDPKGGACGSLYNIHKDERLNHRFQVFSGIMEKECSLILKEFFQEKRKG